jgi:hypothetical protein
MATEAQLKYWESKKGKLPKNFYLLNTKKSIKKLSKSLTGRIIPQKTRDKMSIAKKNMSVATKQKMSKSKKGIMPKNKVWGRKGESNPAYLKDRSLIKKRDERNDPAYQVFVKECKKRDNYRCKINNQDCSGYCIVYHILSWRDYPELRYNINNGITLCQFHHPRKRDEEQKLIPTFKELIETAKII